MKSETIKILLKQIKENKLTITDLNLIVENYLEYGFSKANVRKLISTFEHKTMQNIGVLGRETTSDIKEKLKKDFHVETIIVKNHSDKDINQSFRIGDLVYIFNLKDKLNKILK